VSSAITGHEYRPDGAPPRDVGDVPNVMPLSIMPEIEVCLNSRVNACPWTASRTDPKRKYLHIALSTWEVRAVYALIPPVPYPPPPNVPCEQTVVVSPGAFFFSASFRVVYGSGIR